MEQASSTKSANTGRRKTQLVLFDQAIVSGANFVIGLVLARFLGPAGYGQFVLTYNVILFVAGIQAALIIAPMMVNTGVLPAEQRSSYLRIVALQQMLFCLVLAIAIFVAVKVLGPHFPQWGLDALLWGLIFSTVSVLSQDFFRRYFFANDHAGVAALNDLVTHGGKFVLLAGLGLAAQLTVTNAIWIVGGASALGAALAAITPGLRNHTLAVDSDKLSQVTHKHWTFGKWLLAENLVYWCGSQLVIYVAGQVVSTSLVGAMSAAANVVGMVNILFLALENLIPTRAAAIYAKGGKTSLTRYLKRVAFIGGGSILAIVIVASIWSEYWLKLFYGPAYAGYGWMIVWWSGYYVMNFLQRPLSIGLRVLGNTRDLFFASLGGAVVAICFSYPIIRTGGAIGAMIAVCLVHACTLLVLTLRFRRSLQKSSA
jgi:O-antigen/teichoic acid export membrane protein